MNGKVDLLVREGIYRSPGVGRHLGKGNKSEDKCFWFVWFPVGSNSSAHTDLFRIYFMCSPVPGPIGLQELTSFRDPRTVQHQGHRHHPRRQRVMKSVSGTFDALFLWMLANPLHRRHCFAHFANRKSHVRRDEEACPASIPGGRVKRKAHVGPHSPLSVPHWMSVPKCVNV